MAEITIIIPTFNRSNYLRRILGYYSRYNVNYDIIVVDSSSEKEKAINKEAISSFSNLEILYLDNYSFGTDQRCKVADAANYVKGKYCVICADDDFIVPSAIKECINFMEENPDYSVVLGKYCGHSLKQRRNGKIKFYWEPGYYYGESITFDDSFKRLKFRLANYIVPSLYGVHRTSTIQFIFEEVVKTTSHGRLGEILLGALTLISGKMKILPIFYSSREPGSHSIVNTLNTVPYFLTSWSSFLVHDNFNTEYKKAVACLAKNLQKQTGFNIDKSTKIAKDALDGYLDLLRQSFIGENRGYFRKLLKKILKKVHLLYLYQQIHNMRPIKKEYLELMEKNDPRFQENFNQIKKTVIKSEIYTVK